jgi:hypothetical protein
LLRKALADDLVKLMMRRITALEPAGK